MLAFLAVILAAATTPQQAFERLKGLAGEWDATEEGRPSPAQFERLAGGTVVMQRSGFVAMYHLDGDSLLVTGYTHDGNQPRLRAKGASLQAERFEFKYVDATNLKAGATHADGLEIAFQPDGSFRQTWHFSGGKAPTSITMAFSKKARQGSACPPEELIEALHAATFHFEHGLSSDGRSALGRARELARETLDSTVRSTLERLSLVEQTVDRDPNRALSELEWIRVAFRDWSCLPEPLHQRFHSALPPIK